jgi:hypothetical protein
MSWEVFFYLSRLRVSAHPRNINLGYNHKCGGRGGVQPWYYMAIIVEHLVSYTNIICQSGSSLQGFVSCQWNPRRGKMDLETNVKSAWRGLRTEVDAEADCDRICRWKTQVYGILTAKSEMQRQWVNCGNGSVQRKWRKALNECIVEIVWQYDVADRSNQRM